MIIDRWARLATLTAAAAIVVSGSVMTAAAQSPSAAPAASGSGCTTASATGGGSDIQLPDVEAGKFNVAMVLLGPHDDGGWSQAHYDGLQYLCANVPDAHVAYVESIPDDPTSEQVFRSLARKGFDLIISGNKGFGGDNASVGPMLAEILGIAQANVVTKLEILDGRFRAEREGDADSEVLEGALPAVITAQRGLNEPRYANLKGIMAAKKKTIEEVDGAAVAPAVTTLTLALPPSRPEGRKLEGDAAAQAAALLGLLRDEAKVL